MESILPEVLDRRIPYSRWQYVDVTFSSTADQDTVIPHTLVNNNPEGIHYQVVKKDRAGDVYQDLSATRRAWGNGYIILRCTVASVQATLLLTTPR